MPDRPDREPPTTEPEPAPDVAHGGLSPPPTPPDDAAGTPKPEADEIYRRILLNQDRPPAPRPPAS